MTTVEPSTVDPYELTPAGWPRPVVEGWPIPWVAPAHQLSEVNEGRRLASVGGAVCQVCGLGWGWGEDGYAFVKLQEGDAEFLPPGSYLSKITEVPSQPIFFLDGAIMHLKCAALSAARCPHIAGRTDLFCVRVPANDATPIEDDAGVLRPTYPAADCELVRWPVRRRPS